MSGPGRLLIKRIAGASLAPRICTVNRIALPARPALQSYTFFQPTCIPITYQCRAYAKKANKKKNAAAAVEDKDEQVTKAFDEDKVKEKMDNIVKSLKEHYASMRVGRANPGKMS